MVHWFLNRADEPVSAVFGHHDIEDLERDVSTAAAGLLIGDFAPAAVPHRSLCGVCPGRSALCSWDETMTGRELPADAPNVPA